MKWEWYKQKAKISNDLSSQKVFGKLYIKTQQFWQFIYWFISIHTTQNKLTYMIELSDSNLKWKYKSANYRYNHM